MCRGAESSVVSRDKSEHSPRAAHCSFKDIARPGKGGKAGKAASSGAQADKRKQQAEEVRSRNHPNWPIIFVLVFW